MKEPYRPYEQEFEIGKERWLLAFYLVTDKLTDPGYYKNDSANKPQRGAAVGLPHSQLNHDIRKQHQNDKHHVRQRWRKLVIIIDSQSYCERSPIEITIIGAEKFEVRKGYRPQQTKQAKHNQRNTYPMNQLVCWILMIFGILIKIDINGPPGFNHRSNLSICLF